MLPNCLIIVIVKSNPEVVLWSTKASLVPVNPVVEARRRYAHDRALFRSHKGSSPPFKTRSTLYYFIKLYILQYFLMKNEYNFI